MKRIKRVKLFFFVFTVCWVSSASAKWYSFDDSKSQDESFKIEVLRSTSNGTEMVFELNGFDQVEKVINKNSYSQITVPGLNAIDQKGYPELPRWNGNLLVPTESFVEISDVQVEQQAFHFPEVKPSKGPIFRNQIPSLVPYTFSPFYTVGQGAFPSNWVSIEQNFVLRKASGVNIAVRPFRYDIGTGLLLVAKKIFFKVNTFGGVRGLSFKGDQFINVYKRTFLNYNALLGEREIDSSHVMPDNRNLLIIAHDYFMGDALDRFIEWKQQAGVHVQIFALSDVGQSWQDIQKLVREKYFADDISTLILVGDAEFIPYRPGIHGKANNQEADPLYGAVEGEDVYPELMVSRFSVQTEAELDTIVTKIIHYEKYPDLDGQWYSKGLGIASAQGSSDLIKYPSPSGNGGIRDYERAELLREMLEGWHYISVEGLYDGIFDDVKAHHVLEALNEGRGFVNYIGHGHIKSWQTTGFRNEDIDALENGQKLPFIVSVACLNGKFSGYDSFAEKWMSVGSSDSPKGAIAVYAASVNQSWDPPTIGQFEITRSLTKGEMTTIGTLFAHGAIAVLEDNSSTAEETFESWIIFGDATMLVRTQIPQVIEAHFDPESIGDPSFEAYVGEPGITMAITQKGLLIARGVSNKRGTIDLKFLNQKQEGSILITFTGFNKIPLIIER